MNRNGSGIGAIAGRSNELPVAVGACACSAGTLAPDFISQQEPRCWAGVSDTTGEPARFIIGQPAGHSLAAFCGAQLAATAKAVEDIAIAAISIRAASWSRRDIGSFEVTPSPNSDL